jgi:hypothetical protein
MGAFERTSYVKENDCWGILGPDEIFRAKGPKNAADAATCHYIIFEKNVICELNFMKLHGETF